MNYALLLTYLRIMLLPCAWYLYTQFDLLAALGVLAVAMLTDFLDGWVARRFGQATAHGALMDPVADKALLICAYSLLGHDGFLPWWVSCTVIVRNISQLLAIPILSWWLRREFFVKPKQLPKWATALSMIYIFVPFSGDIDPALIPLGLVIVALELYILATYLPRLIQIARGRHDTFE